MDGDAKKLDAAPLIRFDRTMLPVRFIAEKLGAKVAWNGTTSTVTVTAADTVIEIVIGARTARVNGSAVTLDAPAFIEQSRTYLPVRFVAEKYKNSVSSIYFGFVERYTEIKDVQEETYEKIYICMCFFSAVVSGGNGGKPDRID